MKFSLAACSPPRTSTVLCRSHAAPQRWANSSCLARYEAMARSATALQAATLSSRTLALARICSDRDRATSDIGSAWVVAASRCTVSAAPLAPERCTATGAVTRRAAASATCSSRSPGSLTARSGPTTRAATDPEPCCRVCASSWVRTPNPLGVAGSYSPAPKNTSWPVVNARAWKSRASTGRLVVPVYPHLAQRPGPDLGLQLTMGPG